MVASWGLTDGSTASMVNAQTSLDTSDLQLHRPGYLDDPDLANVFSRAQLAQLKATLRGYKVVDAVALRLVSEGLLQSAYGSQGVSVRGVEPDLEARVTQLGQRVVAGRLVSQPGEVVLGQTLAKKLDVRLGERVVLNVQGVKRTRSEGLRLVGVVHAGLALLDQATAFVHLDDVRQLTGVEGASDVVIALNPGANAQRFRQTLQRALGDGVEVSSVFELHPLISAMVRIGRFEMLPMMLLLAALAGFGVANTVTFSVLKRLREFGVVLALGLRPKQLARLITLETVFVSLAGFLVGALLGYGLNVYLERVGINMGFYSGTFPDLGIPQVIHAKATWVHSLYALIVVIVTAVVASRYPARRVSNLEPTEAMRYV